MKIPPLRIVVAISLFFSAIAYCGNLAPPYALESTQVLPEGVRNPRFLSVHRHMNTRFSENGLAEPLGQRLNKVVTWKKVLESYDNNKVKQTLLRSVLEDNKLESGPGTATGMVNVYGNVSVPVLAMGVSDHLTLGLVVPVYRIDVSVNTAFVRSSEGEKFISSLCESSPSTCNEAADKLNNAITDKLSDLHYEPLRSHTISHIGDMMLMGKYRLLNTEKNALAAKLSLTLPTGTKSNPNRALDITTGDGRFKIGAALVYDFYFPSNITLNFYGGYTAQLPHGLQKRIPISADDSLVDITETQDVTRKWGDIISAGSAISCPITKLGLTLTAGYNLQYQSKSRYETQSTERAIIQRTRLLEELELTQVLHSVVTGVGFSTVDWYRSKSFFLPLQVNLVYSHPFAGMNTPSNDVIAGEMVLFF